MVHGQFISQYGSSNSQPTSGVTLSLLVMDIRVSKASLAVSIQSKIHT